MQECWLRNLQKRPGAHATLVLFFTVALTLGGCGAPDEPLSTQVEPPFEPTEWQEKTRASLNGLINPLLPLAGLPRALSDVPQMQAVLDPSGFLSLIDNSGARLALGLPMSSPTELLGLMGAGFSWKPENVPISGGKIPGLPAHSHGTDSFRVERMTLTYLGIPVHLAQAISLYDDGMLAWINARLPHWASQSALGLPAHNPVVGPFVYTGEQLTAAYAQSRGWSQEITGPAEPTWLLTSEGLAPAFQFIVSSSQEATGSRSAPAQPLRVLMSADTGSVLEELPLAFHLTGSARIFKENDVASAREGMALVALPDLNGEGNRLSHPLFDIKNCNLQVVSSTKCTFRADAPGGDYTIIDYENVSYDEVVAYFALTRAMQWYRDLMREQESLFPGEKTWAELDKDFGLGSGKERLTVFVRAQSAKPGGGFTLDNAVYLPAGSDGLSDPEIVIGSGWEADQASVPRGLQYLGKDTDVSMHEFGHHVIYRAITEIKGQSLAMHEGFADYFTYAITGNNLLAESVVSTGVPLRSATRKGTLDQYPPASTPPHLAGEFWSSVLWDIRMQIGPWVDEFHKFDKILWHAVDLMRNDETYYGAISAISRSAQSFAETVGEDPVGLKKIIFQNFYLRGFIQAPQGDGTLPAASQLLTTSSPAAPGLSGSSSTPQAKKKPTNDESGVFGLSCAIGTRHAASPLDLGTLLVLAALFLAPLLARVRTGEAVALARQRSRRRQH